MGVQTTWNATTCCGLVVTKHDRSIDGDNQVTKREAKIDDLVGDSVSSDELRTTHHGEDRFLLHASPP